jgi:hypothetical protein
MYELKTTEDGTVKPSAPAPSAPAQIIEEVAEGPVAPLAVHVQYSSGHLVTSAAAINDVPLVQKQIQNGHSCNERLPEDVYQNTPLHWAVAYLSPKMAESISHAPGVNFTLRNAAGYTALGAAAKKAMSVQAKARATKYDFEAKQTTAQAWNVVEAICSAPGFKKATAETPDNGDPFQSGSALYCAVKSRNLNIAKKLLMAGASVRYKEPQTDNSLLQVAIIEGFGPMISLLLAHNCGCTADGKVDNNYRNAVGQNATALVIGNPELETILGEEGKDYQPWNINKEDQILSGFYNSLVWGPFLSKVKSRVPLSYVELMGQAIYDYVTDKARMSETRVQTKTKEKRYSSFWNDDTMQDVSIMVPESVYTLARIPNAKTCVMEFIKTSGNKKAIAQYAQLANPLRCFFLSSPNTRLTLEPTSDSTKGELKELYDMSREPDSPRIK